MSWPHIDERLAADQAHADQRAVADLMGRDELPAMPLDTREAIMALGVRLGPGGSLVTATMPHRWSKAPHLLDPHRFYVLDEQRVRRLEVYWQPGPLFSRTPSHGTVTVLEPDGLGYRMVDDIMHQQLALTLSHGRSHMELRVDRFTLADRTESARRMLERTEALARRHVVEARLLRFSLLPWRQPLGGPVVLDAAPAEDVQGIACMPPTPLRLPPLPQPSTKTRWRAFPPSRRRRMKSWQEAARQVKAAYEPLRGHLARHGGRTPGWAVDPREARAWRDDHTILRRHVVELPELHHDVIVYAERELDPHQREAVVARAKVLLCQHAWRPVHLATYQPLSHGGWAEPLAMTCQRCGARGLRTGNEVVLAEGPSNDRDLDDQPAPARPAGW